LARDFIDALTKGFDPAKYHDEYRERLAALIEAKAQGQTVTLPAAPPPPGAPAKVINPMEALRQSVEQVKKPPAKADGVRVAAAPPKRDEKPARAKGGRRGRVA